LLKIELCVFVTQTFSQGFHVENNSSVLSVRISASERQLLASAAEDARTSISDFVRRKSIEAAELKLLERSVVKIPAADWDKFEAWMNSPPIDMPKIRALAQRPLAWEK
jgi:uncharacterized protein (DUF1778 family)